MRAFGPLNPAKTESAQAVALGEVLNGKYVVKAVEESDNGRPQYRCVTLRGHDEVLVRYVGRKKNADNASLALLSHSKLRSTEATNDDESSYSDRFEVRSGKDTLVYAVEAKPPNAFNASSSPALPQNEHQQQDRGRDVEDQKADGEPERRPAPYGSRILTYKRGDGKLELDIPSYGVWAYTVCLTLFSAVWIGSVCCWTIFVLTVAVLTANPAPLLIAFFSVPAWIGGFTFVRGIVRSSFTHENLIITPTNFRIKRTVEFRRQHRDSVNNAARAEAPLTRKDRIFCKQLEGATSALTIAATRWATSDDRNISWGYFVLLEGQKAHTLCNRLSDDERDWLVSEVNGTLTEIKGNYDPL